jgi:hypothetical protein
MASDEQVCELALRRARHIATVCDEIYERWESEVMALPVRKRKNWAGWMRDNYGCRVSVRYSPQPVGCGLQTLFEGRITAKTAADRRLPEGSWIPYQSVSMRAERVAIHAAQGRELTIIDASTHRREKPILDKDALIERAIAPMVARRTGNHRPHAHAVRIPTAAGQPVRG